MPTSAAHRVSLADRASAGLTWSALVVVTVVFSTLIAASVLLFGWVDRRRRIPHALAVAWARTIFLCHPHWRVTITGRERLQPGRAYIFTANHQSFLDIPAGLSVGGQFKWVAKAELFDLPFLGWSMALAGYVKLARGERTSIRETYLTTKRWLAHGISVFFFPEGTRSFTGELGAFKNGAFKLAIDAGIPVVPVAISGTRELLARGSFLVGRSSGIRVAVLPPLDPANYRGEFARLRDDARRAIALELAHGRASS
ncbi:MAG: 1-acyl-sn-glycerol-3-phosphate acyltransferase [Candidatus Omnitrophica bacterium]|nr:1-acyl-sn-glycerol-3-phosphate acyltransferase [Candidatus Omnitrophota bacterium]